MEQTESLAVNFVTWVEILVLHLAPGKNNELIKLKNAQNDIGSPSNTLGTFPIYIQCFVLSACLEVFRAAETDHQMMKNANKTRSQNRTLDFSRESTHFILRWTNVFFGQFTV